MNTAVKISFGVGLVVGIAAVLFIAVFRSTESSYVAQVVPPEEAVVPLPEPVASPIVEEVRVSSAGAYTMDGGELYAFRADKRWPVASITKLMTALVASELFGLDETVTITEEMVATEGTSGGLAVGERIRVEDLLDAMLIVSSNDAATALAMHYGESAFVTEMNRYAADIGMADTLYVDPSGLSVQNLSTVQDLRTLAKYIFENKPYLFAITRRPSGFVADLGGGTRWELKNINEFAGRSDFIGGKTGRTPEAEGNLLSVFKVPGREDPVVIVVLGTEDRFAETLTILAGL